MYPFESWRKNWNYGVGRVLSVGEWVEINVTTIKFNDKFNSIHEKSPEIIFTETELRNE